MNAATGRLALHSPHSAQCQSLSSQAAPGQKVVIRCCSTGSRRLSVIIRAAKEGAAAGTSRNSPPAPGAGSGGGNSIVNVSPGRLSGRRLEGAAWPEASNSHLDPATPGTEAQAEEASPSSSTPAATELQLNAPPAPVPPAALSSGRRGSRSGVMRVYRALNKPLGLVVTSAYVLGAAVKLSGVDVSPAWLPALAGGVLGGLYAGLNGLGMRRFWRSPQQPLNVVITGGTRGIGKALAREFLRSGDRVLITARSMRGVQQAAAALREEVGPEAEVFSIDCDVSSAQSVERLAAVAQARLGTVDVWINNAGYSGSFQHILDASPSQLEQVVRTNLLGALLCTQAAMRLMAAQPGGGHVFNMDGAGADGMATPQYAAYGASKAGIAQLYRTLQQETAGLGPGSARVAVHNLSPGMVLTDLLLEGATHANKQVFNILCEHPETVAAFLVPRARTVVARGLQGQYIRYLTMGRALLRFLTAPARGARFFNKHGEATYPPERERILGEAAREETERQAAAAARRSHTLGLAYSLSLAASYLLFVADALLQRGHTPSG